jgi:hypothetical protein
VPDAAGREIGPDAAICHGGQIGFGSKAALSVILCAGSYGWNERTH